MNISEHDCYPAPRLVRSAFLFHPDSSHAPESRTPGGFAAVDTIGKDAILLREKNLSLAVREGVIENASLG
jgi:hypothetical protein